MIFPSVWEAAELLLQSIVAGQPDRLMLKRQKEGTAMNAPFLMEAGIQMFAEACPDAPPTTCGLLRTALDEGFRSIDRQLDECGPLHPERFNLQEANARLCELTMPYRRLWS